MEQLQEFFNLEALEFYQFTCAFGIKILVNLIFAVNTLRLITWCLMVIGVRMDKIEIIRIKKSNQ